VEEDESAEPQITPSISILSLFSKDRDLLPEDMENE